MTTRQVDIWLPFNKNFIGGGYFADYQWNNICVVDKQKLIIDIL